MERWGGGGEGLGRGGRRGSRVFGPAHHVALGGTATNRLHGLP
jgi:hypothetical protein